jgi:Protein of unknown function (DUF4054)
MAGLTLLPDATSMKTRFPEFSGTADAVIMFAVEEAASNIDDTWPEADQIAAVAYLAAHYLAIGGASAGVDGREVISESIGPISVTYAQASSGAAGSGGTQLDATAYGKSFLSLVRRNFGGPRSLGDSTKQGTGWVPWWPTPRYR